MNVNSVNPSFAQANNYSKKSNPVKTGAKIGAAAGVAVTGLGTFNLYRQKGFIKDILAQLPKSVSKTKVGIGMAIGVAVAGGIYTGIGAAIGAGIGAIVKACSKKEKEEE